ncbi:MAG: serine/threonine-protein kinase, partial [Rubrivivax sp.]
MSTLLPERIGKYTISALLGRGAMGMVYKGFDPHIARPVAVKTIHRELLGTDEHASIAARFRNEAQAVGRLQHAGIVAIYEFGEDEATAYIAMEYVEGSNLDQVLAGTPLLPERQVQRITVELLDALECAHRHGVWHRDIKPGNLILTRTGQVKLADFGIARIENQSLTQVASTIGTPGYMAPQQYTGEGVDHRADLFAAGVLLYRLLTGVQPFTGSPETLMYKILNEHPRPP